MREPTARGVYEFSGAGQVGENFALIEQPIEIPKENLEAGIW
jgi:hypothetical protein